MRWVVAALVVVGWVLVVLWPDPRPFGWGWDLVAPGAVRVGLVVVLGVVLVVGWAVRRGFGRGAR